MSRTIWLTGFSASGKSTLAQAVRTTLVDSRQICKIIDGDELRRGLCFNLGYSRPDRRENVRRAAEACRLLNEAGVTVIAALVSPYRDDREMARQIIGQDAFFEVWLSTPIDVCEQRDPKGLYQQARAGQIKCFTGISDPYEPPISPHLELDTHRLNTVECMARIEALLSRPTASDSP
jgi:adenylylsulfate kinase